jgi:hypothetical protein
MNANKMGHAAKLCDTLTGGVALGCTHSYYPPADQTSSISLWWGTAIAGVARKSLTSYSHPRATDLCYELSTGCWLPLGRHAGASSRWPRRRVFDAGGRRRGPRLRRVAFLWRGRSLGASFSSGLHVGERGRTGGGLRSRSSRHRQRLERGLVAPNGRTSGHRATTEHR